MHTDLLTMLKCSPEVYGKEIQEIESASDKYCIKYFEKVLAKLLDWYSTVNSKYFNVTTCGKGDIESIQLKDEGFGLTKEQCFEIHSYMNFKVFEDRINNQYKLNHYDSIIILNYIQYNYKLSDCAYEFKYNPNKNWV